MTWSIEAIFAIVTLLLISGPLFVLVIGQWRRYRSRRQKRSDVESLTFAKNGKSIRERTRKVTLYPKHLGELDVESQLNQLRYDEGKRSLFQTILSILTVSSSVRLNPRPLTVYPIECGSGSRTPKRSRNLEEGVNPWDLEYEPNPVIFPHLARRPPSSQPDLQEHSETTVGAHTNDSESIGTPSLAGSSSSSLDNNTSSSSLSDVDLSRTSEDSGVVSLTRKERDNDANQ